MYPALQTHPGTQSSPVAGRQVGGAPMFSQVSGHREVQLVKTSVSLQMFGTSTLVVLVIWVQFQTAFSQVLLIETSQFKIKTCPPTCIQFITVFLEFSE